MKKKRSLAWSRLLVLLGLFVLWVGLFAAWSVFWPLKPSDTADNVTIRIPYGAFPAQIADSLATQKVVRSACWFRQTARFMGVADQLKAGMYRLTVDQSAYSAVTHIARGEQVYVRVTVAEGLPARQIAHLMSKSLEIDSLRFMQRVEDSLFIQTLALDVPSLEGYLYPDTYHFTLGTDIDTIIQRMVQQLKKVVPDSFYQRSEKMGFDFRQVLTLASIIEGEALLTSEMTIISSVYHNRLRRGMPLQADPTIQYLISDGPRRLLWRDLKIESPYNTYLHIGLPPGPINSPGIDAIEAALYPQDTPYLYFVADGRGGHRFSTTLQEHNLAKKQFDQIRRQVAQEKREKANREQSLE